MVAVEPVERVVAQPVHPRWVGQQCATDRDDVELSCFEVVEQSIDGCGFDTVAGTV
jgi:hypothetical protein